MDCGLDVLTTEHAEGISNDKFQMTKDIQPPNPIADRSAIFYRYLEQVEQFRDGNDLRMEQGRLTIGSVAVPAASDEQNRQGREEGCAMKPSRL